MNRAKTIAAIVFSEKNCNNLIKNLKLILNFNDDIAVFVLDKSKDNSLEFVKNAINSEKLHCIQAKNNQESYNHIYQKACETYNFDYFICLDESGIAKYDMVEKLLSASKKLNDNCIVEALQFPVENPKIYNRNTNETPWCSARCLLFPRDIFEAVCGFDENLHGIPASADISWRVKQLGAKCIIEPGALFGCETEKINTKDNIKSACLLGRKYKNQTFEEKYFNKFLKMAANKEVKELETKEVSVNPNKKFTNFSDGLYFARRRF